MPVVPWDGTPLFGGKTLVLPGGAYGRKKPLPDTPVEDALEALDQAAPVTERGDTTDK